MFTDREKKLLLIKFIVHGVSPFSTVPVEKRVQMLEGALNNMGIKVDEQELYDLGEEIIKFQGEAIGDTKTFLKKHNDVVIRSHTELTKGSDSLVGLLGSDLTKEGLKALKDRDVGGY